MKSILKITILFLAVMFTTSGQSQVLNNIDEITPYHENLAAVRKGEQWAFINDIGAITINFREDIVDDLSRHYPVSDPRKKISYPYFSNDRCLVKDIKDGISYFGYINKKGDVVIDKQYVNATPFTGGYAMVLRITKELLGTNKLLAKNVVSYSYDEVLIDVNGKVIMHLEGPKHLILSKEKLRRPPVINSYFITENLLAVKNKNDKWEIRAL